MLLADELFSFPGLPAGRTLARCRLRVFLPEDDGGAAAYVVVATDDEHARGTSITNAAEVLAAAVCQRWNIPPSRLTWTRALRLPPPAEGQECSRRLLPAL